MCIARDEECRELIERNGSPRNRELPPLKLRFDSADGAAHGVSAEQEAPGSAAAVQLVPRKERLIVVGNSPVSRIEQETCPQPPRGGARAAYSR